MYLDASSQSSPQRVLHIIRFILSAFHAARKFVTFTLLKYLKLFILGKLFNIFRWMPMERRAWKFLRHDLIKKYYECSGATHPIRGTLII